MSNLLNKASIIITPTGYDTSELLAIKPSNGDGDLDFSRASTATRTNALQTIENVSINVPRIDYTGGVGSILLEPQSTNLFRYSEDFSNSYWTKSNSTVSLFSEINPQGNSSTYKLIENNTTSTHMLNKSFSITASVDYTLSFFVKKADYDYIQFGFGGNFGNTHSNINLTNGNVESENGQNAKVENFGNGWYRVSATKQASNTIGYWFVTLINSASAPRNQSYLGDGVSGTYVFGAQLEQQSFPTSYIPTSGSSVTRLAETLTNSGNADLFNDSEGVLYAEIGALSGSSVQSQIELGDGSDSTQIKLGWNNNRVITSIQLNTTSVLNFQYNTGSDLLEQEYYKVAIKYKSGQSSVFIDGVEVATSSTTYTNTDTISQLGFQLWWGGTPFYGKARNLRVYTKALTDTELQELTTQ